MSTQDRNRARNRLLKAVEQREAEAEIKSDAATKLTEELAEQLYRRGYDAEEINSAAYMIAESPSEIDGLTQAASEDVKLTNNTSRSPSVSD